MQWSTKKPEEGYTNIILSAIKIITMLGMLPKQGTRLNIKAQSRMLRKYFVAEKLIRRPAQLTSAQMTLVGQQILLLHGRQQTKCKLGIFTLFAEFENEYWLNNADWSVAYVNIYRLIVRILFHWKNKIWLQLYCSIKNYNFSSVMSLVIYDIITSRENRKLIV